MNGRLGSWLVFLGGLIAALLAVVIVVLLTGDGGGSNAAASTSSTTSPEATSTPASDPSEPTGEPTGSTATSAAVVPGTAPAATPPPAAAMCVGVPSVPIPASATEVTHTFGDLDGDGVDDQFSVYRVGVTWYGHVLTATGVGVQAELTPYAPGASPWAEQVIDVGFQEELGLAGSGFTLVGPIYQVWQLIDCELRLATADGGDFEPYVGIGLVHGESFACTSDGMVQYETSQPGADPAAWIVTETRYAWNPAAGDFNALAPTTTPIDAASAQALVADIGC